MPFRIDWKSCSQWVGTTQTEQEGDEIFETREEAEKALAKLQNDSAIMSEVHDTAVQGQGVKGWLEIVDSDD